MILPLSLLSLAGGLAVSNAASIPGMRFSEPVEAERIDTRQSNATYWKPPMRSNIQFVLTGIPDLDDSSTSIAPNSGIYEVDMFYTPAATVKKMQELGQKVICYFSAATAENWRDDYSQFRQEDMGTELPDWPGERYLDIRKDTVWKVIEKRIETAHSKGCDAIEPDNVDVYSNNPGFQPPIVPGDTVTYLHKVSQKARNYGMAVGIKNCVEILGDIFKDIDFAISEECVQYKNCTAYANFTTRSAPGEVGKPVFEVEYVNYTYDGEWTDDGVAVTPNDFSISNDNWPSLRGQELRNVLCNLNEPGASLQNPYLKINTIIKTLALDGFIMYCDGHVEKTKTKDVGKGRNPGKMPRRSWAREKEWRRMGGGYP